MKQSYPRVYFSNIQISSTSVHKHLEILHNDKLSYEHHLKFALNKVKNTIGLLRKFARMLPIHSLVTSYKLFIQPHIDYGDIVYDIAFKESFRKNYKSI